LFTPTDTYWTDYRVISIAASDADNAIAVGKNCAIYRTEDGGKTWLKEFAPNTSGVYDMEYEDMFYITYPEKNNAYLAGGGYILKMTNEKVLSRPNLNRYFDKIDPSGIIAFWNPVTSAKKYQLQIANAGTDNTYNIKKFDNLIFDAFITDTLVTLPDMDYNSCYYGRIKAVNDDMESGWNVKAGMFCTIQSSEYTIAPSFIYPKQGSSINTINFEFKWSSVAGAEEYQLQYCDNPFFMGTLSEHQNIKDTIAQSGDLVYGVTYYARVKVAKGTKLSGWAYTNFTVVDPSNVINIDIGDNKNISIYPNPASEYIEITLFGNSSLFKQGIDERLQMQVFNALGEIVINSDSKLTDGDGIRIDISFLTPGVYFLKIGNKVSKFVKK
jgi:hypothetical protein